MYTESWLSDFLYDLYRFDYQEAFPRHLLQVLTKHFGFQNIGFLRPIRNSTEEAKEDPDWAMMEVIEEVCGFDFLPAIQSRYNALYSPCDEMSYMRRRKDLPSTRHTISSQEIYNFECTMDYKNLTDFLTNAGIRYYLSLYLFTREGAYLGRIGFNNLEEDGDFSPEAQTMLNQVAGHIVQAYLNTTAHAQAIHKLTLLEAETASLPIGLIILDQRFEIIRMNQTAEAYCREIMESEEEDTQRVMEEFQSLLIAEIACPKSAKAGKIRVDFQNGTHLYSCVMTPCIIKNQPQKNVAYYFLHINKEPCLQARDMGAFYARYGLTNQERNVTALIEQGFGNQEISQELGVSGHTVKSHIRNIFKKAGVSNRMMLLQKIADYHCGAD